MVQTMVPTMEHQDCTPHVRTTDLLRTTVLVQREDLLEILTGACFGLLLTRIKLQRERASAQPADVPGKIFPIGVCYHAAAVVIGTNTEHNFMILLS